MMAFTIATIPGEFQWHIPPAEWSYEPTKGLFILAGPRTDWFTDPAGIYTKDNAPCALAALPENTFLLSAKVSVRFTSPFDAGVFQIRTADDRWAKLCFEYSPQKRPMIVSVVTRGVSDDCNSVEVKGTEVYLRVARMPRTIAFHYSTDSRFWHFVRYFNLEPMGFLRVGFSAQSPMGEQCGVIFSEINYRRGGLQDIRNGE